MDRHLKKLFVIYTNAYNMLRERGYDMDNQITKEKTFIETYMNSPIIISDKNMGIVLYIFKGIYASKKSFIKKDYLTIMKIIPKYKTLKEIIIVTNTNIKPTMLSYIKNDPYKKKYSIYYIYFARLTIHLTKHTYVPQHILLNKEEEKYLFDNSTYVKESMRNILETDPVSIWYNARDGDVFKIIRKDNVGIVEKNMKNNYINNLEEIVYAVVKKDTDLYVD